MKAPHRQTQRVVVVDGQPLARAGLHALVDALPGFACIGAAADRAGGLQACLDLQPDIVLLDLHLPGGSSTSGRAGHEQPEGLELARTLNQAAPRQRVVALSSRCDAETVRAALRAGVAGFVAKDDVLEHLQPALQAAAEGSRWLSQDLADGLAGAEAPAPQLTPRQREVLTLIARGRSNKEIARNLGVSVKTVEYHRAELIQRLDRHDVASLTRYAIEQGLA